MKYHLKFLFFLFLVPFLVLSCSSKNRLNDWMKENGKLKILSTTAQIGDLVQEVGGERIDGYVLIQGDLDPHSYELVKGDGEKFERAALIFHNGLGLEHGASLSSLLHENPKAVALGERISASAPNQMIRKQGAWDPHVWMDISLWSQGVDPITSELSRLDPEGEAFYKERGAALKQKMEAAHTELQALLQTVPSEKRYLVTSHDAFHYFTRSYLATPGEADWERRFAAPEGLAPDGQLSPVDIQKIIDFLRIHRIAVLFPESNVSRDSIKKIVSAGREMGLEIEISLEALYGDSMSGLSYLEMMKCNGETIAKHLGKTWNTH